MDLRHVLWGSVFSVSLGVAAAMAQTPPADCSEGDIPDGPLVLRMAGMPDRPLSVIKITNSGGVQVTAGGQTYRTRSIVLTDRVRRDVFDPVVQVEAGFLVAERARLDARTFRKPPAKSGTPQYDAQEKVGGQVVFQHWSVKIPAPSDAPSPYVVQADHVFFIASARIEFGRQSGRSLPGKIHLCIPGNQVVFGGTLEKPIEVVGSFTASVE